MSESLQRLPSLHSLKGFLVLEGAACWNRTCSLGIFSVRVEEVKGAREGSRSKDSDISGVFGATLSPQDLPAALAFPETGHTLSRCKVLRNL